MASELKGHILAQSTVNLPRVEIRFCVKCKWNLRAAYYAQELLQTFSETIGEIALVPVTGGIFTITLYHASPSTNTISSPDDAPKVTDKPTVASPPPEPALLDQPTPSDHHGDGSKREKSRLSISESIASSLSHVGQGPMPLPLSPPATISESQLPIHSASVPAPVISPIIAHAVSPLSKSTGARPDTDEHAGVEVQVTQIWDRKIDGGFPETKELKDRVRNVIDPNRGLGHIDRVLGKDKEKKEKAVEGKGHGHGSGGKEDCVECRDATRES